MISFLFPGFLYAAGAVALGVVLLHLLVTQQPKSDVLPTVRFFPDVLARSTSITIRPSDLWLLLLRVLMILLIGAAFAQPQLKPEHRSIARLVAIDMSRAVSSPAELGDSARRYIAGAAAVVVFDSTAREIAPSSAADSLAAFATRSARPRITGVAESTGPLASADRGKGALSPALITALRAAARVRESADSLEIVVVSPFVQEEADAATETIRALWPGHVRTVRVAAATDAALDSPRGGETTRRPRIEWADSVASTLWVPRAHIDTIGAVRAGDAVLVFPFVRRWQLSATQDTIANAKTRVYARWSDGEPAAVERMTGAGCVRSLAVSIPTAGDAILRPEFVRLADALTEPCGEVRNLGPLPAVFMAALEGESHLAPSSSVKPRATRMTPLVPWLLVAASVLALLELLVRRRADGTVASADIEQPHVSPRRAA